jgi:5'-3' exonuclease
VRLLLIDGHYYVYRSFHAIQNLTNSAGEPTNAIYGFIKTVRKMLKDVKPAFAAVFWDEGMPQKRLLLQPSYKQQREAMPDKMIPQLQFIQSFCRPMGLCSISQPDTEADDLMGCYVIAARQSALDVVLATNDKDLFQLVDNRVTVYSTNKADLKSPKDSHALLGEPEVTLKWGVPPAQIVEVLALTGDTVDNIPGIEGIGAKTAVNLIRQFGTVENLLQQAEQIQSEKLRQRVQESEKQIRDNRQMVQLELDHPLPKKIPELAITPDYNEYIRGLERYEFKSLIQELREEAARAGVARQGELELG